MVQTGLPCLQEEWPLPVTVVVPTDTCHSAMLAFHLAGAEAATASRAHC